MQAQELPPLCPLQTLLEGGSQQQTAAPLLETAVVPDSNAPMYSNEPASPYCLQ